MLRIRTILVCLMIAAAAAGACAEPATSPAPTEAGGNGTYEPRFSFRNGILWNMDPQQVQSLEPVQMTERISGEWSVMVTAEKVSVSRFSANLVFMFFQNRLKMITYEFQSSGGTAVQYQYLTGALCSVYGEYRETNGTDIKAYMDMINSGLYQKEKIRQGHAWTAADGTAVFLYYFDTDRFAIMYLNPEMTVTGNGTYDIQGL